MRLKLFFAFLLSFCAVSAYAQFKASLQGTVMDSKGGVVAGAKMSVRNEATGVTRETMTSDQGFYRVNELPPGVYTVIVEGAGFKQSISKNIVVEAEQPRGYDVILQIGAVQESITVSASAEGLQTENASTTNTISSQEVLTLPQFGRDPYELIRLTPGVFGDASRQGNGNSFALPQQVGPGGSNNEIFQTENQVQISSNGQRVTANTYTLDGVSVDSLSNGGSAVITPNQESIQEIVVTSASFNAEQGRNSGAQVQVISKGGTNNYHGSGFIKFNDKGLNAFNKFYGPTTGTLPTLPCEGGAFTIVASHCPTRNDQKYRDFGGSLGGPIVHDKLFFFFTYEGLRQSNTISKRDVTLETPAFEKYVIQVNPNSLAAKIFSTPGIAARISTTTKEVDCCSFDNSHPVGAWYTAGNQPNMGQAPGNGPDGTKDWGIYDLTIPNSSSGNQFNGRVDYTRGKDQFFFSSYFVWLNNINGGNRPIEDITFQPHNRVAGVGWTHILSNVLVNEARFNFTRFSFSQLQPQGNTDYGIPQIRIFDFDAGGFGSQDNFLGIPVSGTNPAKFAQNTFAFKDTISWVHRTHALKFGVDITREQNNDNESGAERPNYQFRGLLNFANDACCFDEKIAVDGNTGGLPNGQRYFRTAAYSLFVQDDWKLRPNLTVNLGLRWEYFPPLTEAKGILSNYIFGSQGFINGSVKVVNQLYNSDKNNFGPRIGFAYSPNIWGHKTVLRGGFGILYDRPFGSLFSNARQNTPFFAQAESCCFFNPTTGPNGTGPGITGPPPGSNIGYSLGSSKLASSYPANPNLSFGLAPDGALCGDPKCTFVTPVDLFGALPNEPTPYVYVYSLQTQAEPLHDLQVTIGYQGSRSRKLARTIDLNRFTPGDTFDGNIDGIQSASADGVPCGPTNPACPAPIAVGNNRFKRVFIPLPDGNASFDAGIFEVTRRFSHGFTISSVYTLSHSIDTSSYEIGFQQTDPSNQLIDKGSSDYDVRQHWQLSSYWEIPLLRSRHDFVGRAFGGWTLGGILDKHSGFPFTALIGNCDQSHDRNGDSYCPDMPMAYTGGIISNPSKKQWINGVFPNPAASFPGAARPIPAGTFGPGCRCRNIFSGPGYTDLDVSIGKTFTFPSTRVLGENAKLEFRANLFNALNILNLQPFAPASPPTDITNTGSFGRPADGLSGRVIEFQARFSF